MDHNDHNEEDVKKETLRPEEVQREIEELMREKFGDKVQIVAKELRLDDKEVESELLASLDADLNEEVEQKESESSEFGLNFNYTPKEIKEHLDRYVIQQDDAKKALAIAVCDHYNAVKEDHATRLFGEEDSDEDYAKQNILILGPTGVGKTYLIKKLAKLIGVPFVKADATRFTEAGYVGANVDDMVRDLVSMANDKIELAQYGIIYFDEADKLASSGRHGGKDISGRGVQYSLLKLMEETEIDLNAPNDMISQMKAFMSFQRKGKVSKEVINTKHILFIISGAFFGLEDIIARRLNRHKIGLKSEQSKGESADESDLFSSVSTKDLIDFGLEPEFVGRLPVRLACQNLSEDDLFHILKNSKGTILNQYRRSFKAYGMDINFHDDGLKELAKLAYREKIGARALMTVCERVFRPFKFELPGTGVAQLDVTPELVRNPESVLDQYLQKNSIPKTKQNSHLVQ